MTFTDEFEPISLIGLLGRRNIKSLYLYKLTIIKTYKCIL
jgi:hypothetical protein